MIACDYCKNPAALVVIDGFHYWACEPCKARVLVLRSSVVTGQNLPMGRMLKADGEKLKKDALRRFKRVWMLDADALGRNAARSAAYAWLKANLGRKKLHIDRLDMPDLLLVIAALKEYRRDKK